MLLGVVSDTHGHVPFTLDAVRMLESLQVEVVIHCGDMGSAEIPAYFQQWPTHYVRGNVDRITPPWQQAIETAGGSYHGSFGSLQLAGAGIAFLHGDDELLLHETITSGQWDLVCHGHTHEAAWRTEAKTRVLNPGALYRATPHTLAVVKLPEIEATIVPVSP